MTVVLQKAVPPAIVAAYLTHGYDRISGYVVRAAEVSQVTDFADLRRLHMVDHEGSLHATTGPLHILHVDRSPSWKPLPAEKVAERDVLDASGTVEVAEQLVQVFLLDHTRLTPGARLWRFEEGADPVLVGTYHGAAHGWQDHTRDDVLTAAVPAPAVGAVVVLDGKAYVADVVNDDDGAPASITAVSALEPPESLGFKQNQHGHWVRPVEHAEAQALFEVRITGTWRDHPVQVAQQFRLPDGRNAVRICSLARDWTKAKELGFLELELGVWEHTVPAEDVKDAVPQEIAAQSWLTAPQRERLAKLEEASRSNKVRPAPGGAVRTRGLAPDQPARTTAAGAAASSGGGEAVEPGTIRSAPGTGMKDAAHQALYQRIAKGTIPHLPSGAAEVQVLCEAVGNVMELSAQAILDGDSPVVLPTVSEDVARAFGELRALGLREGGEGPWFGALVRITAAGEFSIRFNKVDRPRMRREITAEMLRVERERFPRDDWPQWFLELEQGAPEQGAPD
ncbi:MAG: hypothetical protein ACQERF_04650 [Actinomycetota bacterium]